MLQARAGASVQAHGQESTMSHAQHRRGAGPCWARRARSSPAPRAAVVGEGARVDGRGKRVCARHRPRVPPRRAMPVRAPVGSGPRRARARANHESSDPESRASARKLACAREPARAALPRAGGRIPGRGVAVHVGASHGVRGRTRCVRCALCHPERPGPSCLSLSLSLARACARCPHAGARTRGWIVLAAHSAVASQPNISA